MTGGLNGYVRIIRELQELSQNDLSMLTGIPQSTLSAIEHGKVNLGLGKSKSFSNNFTGLSSRTCFSWLEYGTKRKAA